MLAGLPCQAFARIGRSKLGALAEIRRPTGRILAQAISPVAGIRAGLQTAMRRAGERPGHFELRRTQRTGGDKRELEAWGYRCGYTLLNAVHYGVPQMRERLFLVALHESDWRGTRFPPPTHWARMPPGYAGVRQFALKYVDRAASHYVEPPLREDPRGRHSRRDRRSGTWPRYQDGAGSRHLECRSAIWRTKVAYGKRAADRLRRDDAELGGLRDRGDSGRARGAPYAARLCAVRSDEAWRAVSGTVPARRRAFRGRRSSGVACSGQELDEGYGGMAGSEGGDGAPLRPGKISEQMAKAAGRNRPPGH